MIFIFGIIYPSQAIIRTNLGILAEWVAAEPLITWVPPKSGTTALLKYDLKISSRDFCVQLLDETGVMQTPGSALDMEGCLRTGYANDVAILKEGLVRLSDFIAKNRASHHNHKAS